MSSFVINGGRPLSGDIHVAGNKNAALPIIAATMLTDEACLLENMPNISDVRAMLAIAASLGKKIEWTAANTVRVSGTTEANDPPPTLMQKLRASILYMGALIARKGTVEFAPPGGCVIGRRNLDAHFEAFREMGVAIEETEHGYRAARRQRKDTLIFLSEASVTATENILLAAAAENNTVIIENAACEPHVADLCRFLIKMGADIRGVGSNRIEIRGRKKLSGAEHHIIADSIESGTFAILAAATRSSLTIRNVPVEDMRPITHVLKKLGVKLHTETSDRRMHIHPSSLRAETEHVKVGLWPGFPTDLMSPAIVLATQGEGSVLFHDWMFESRMFFVDKLIAMGARATLCDPHRVLVSGPTPLKGQILSSPDIRAGIALVIAALSARGESRIDHAELVDRGYENIVQRLRAVGAHIRRVE